MAQCLLLLIKVKTVEGIKVLIIDHDADVINQIKNTFQKHTNFIDIVNIDSDAMIKIINNTYDYYFINYTLKGKCFINMIKEIKTKYKIIVITSDISFENEEEIRSCGITYLLKKPFSNTEITNLMQLDKKQE